MKKIIASLVFVLASATAHANADMDRQSYCSNYASMLKSIAAWRDQGMAPEKTLELMRGVKGIYANSRGTEFGNQVRVNCLAEKSK
jgi:hypothetical protein